MRNVARRHVLRVLPLVAVLGLAPLFGPASAGPTMERREPDPSEASQLRPGLFQDKCGGCHERAGALVREQTVVTGGALTGARSGQDLREFLRGHFGRPSAEEIEAIYAALLRIAQGKGRFHVRCGICHDSAEALARRALAVRDGMLLGRYTGRDIAEFLRGHGTESAQEAAFFEGVLRRQLPPGP